MQVADHQGQSCTPHLTCNFGFIRRIAVPLEYGERMLLLSILTN